jgi:RND family efflux transporter MFP subunit
MAAKNRRWLVAVGLLFGGGSAAAAAWFYAHAAPAAATGAPRRELDTVVVTVEPVRRAPVQRTVAVVGSLYGRDEITLSPKVEGRVAHVWHDVGERVKPGELLLELDPSDYQLAEAEARRAVELELAKLGLKELPEKEFDVRRLPTVERTATIERNAALRHERMVRLGNAASTEDREQAETDHQVARANSRQAVLDAEATLATARQKQSVLETARQKLKDTKIYAPAPRTGSASAADDPIDYAVCQRSVGVGEMVWAMPAFPGAGTSSTLFKLVVDQSLKLQAAVPERCRAAVRLGQNVVLEVEAYPNEKFTGSVSRVNPSVDRSNHTFQVEILVENRNRRLSAGSFAKADIQTALDPAARLVPEEAVVSFAGVTKVFVDRAGRAREVPVRLGATVAQSGPLGSRTYVEVDGDLPDGTPVVTSGQSQLADGVPLRIRQADASEKGGGQ